MKFEYQHKILVVDGDEQVAETIADIPQSQRGTVVFADTGELALEKIEKTNKPFSLIIAEQHLVGIKGIQVLEYAKREMPDTVRFLMAADFETKTIMNAVNKGCIQRYIVKPTASDTLAEFIRSGLLLYELFLDNENLLQLAKKQNAKLYELNCELMESTRHHNKEIRELDGSIEAIRNEIQELSSGQSINPDTLLEEIETNLKKDDAFDSETAAVLFSDTIRVLYEQFVELAHRNGFEMPEMEGDI